MVSDSIINKVLEGRSVNLWHLQLFCVAQTICVANVHVIPISSTECNQISVTVRTHRIFCSLKFRIIRQNWWSQSTVLFGFPQYITLIKLYYYTTPQMTARYTHDFNLNHVKYIWHGVAKAYKVCMFGPDRYIMQSS